MSTSASVPPIDQFDARINALEDYARRTRQQILATEEQLSELRRALAACEGATEEAHFWRDTLSAAITPPAVDPEPKKEE